MNAQQIQERFADHPFVDAFDCLIASIAAAKSRSKLAVRAANMGDLDTAARHRKKRDEYLSDIRRWHSQIDWSDTDD
jgi:hypothetical protein